MHDSDKPAPNGSPPPASTPFVTSPIPFLHPPGFEPAGYLVVAINKEGATFTNTPPDPSLALHLAHIGVQYAVKEAIAALQARAPKSPIVQVPPGMNIPPWQGPAGRG